MSNRQHLTPAPMPPRYRAVLEQVARDHGYTAEDLLHVRAPKPWLWRQEPYRSLTLARDAAIAALRATPNLRGLCPSTTQLGAWMARDHSTICDALARYHRRARTSLPLAA